MRSVHLVNISQKKCLQMTPKNVETQCWIAKTVWQRIPGRRARSNKTPTTKTVQTIALNDHLPLTGRPQMLTTSNVGRWSRRVANFQKMKFGTKRQRRRDRDAVGVEGWEMERGIPLPSRLWGLGSVVSSPLRGPGRIPGRKRIRGILSVAERLWVNENQVFRETFITAYTSAQTFYWTSTG